MPILIRGGTVVNHDHSRRADVLVDDGRIIAVGEKFEAPGRPEIIDAGGLYVMPGGIDPHTHMELMFMGTVSADDFEWGTKAALSGGTTMIVDFCIPAPRQSMLAAYQDWRRKAEKAASDYSFHMAVTARNALAAQHVAQHPAPRERVIQMQLVNPPHDRQVRDRDRPGLQ